MISQFFACLALLNPQPSQVSANEFAQRLSDLTSLPTIVEWRGESLLAFSERREGETEDDYLKRVSGANDLEPVKTDRWLVLRATWLPFTLRSYDLLENWSVAQSKAKPEDYERVGSKIKLIHSSGRSSSPVELKQLGLLRVASISPPFRDYRLVCYIRSIEERDFTRAICACLGADEKQAEKSVEIDPQALRRRRIRIAESHLMNNPVQNSFMEFKSRIEIEVLRALDDKAIKSMFSSWDSEQLITTSPGTPAYSNVMAFWQYVQEMNKRQGRKPDEIAKGSLIQMYGTGKGTFGGRLERPDGYGIYF